MMNIGARVEGFDNKGGDGNSYINVVFEGATLFYEGGITRMHEFISETAQYGALTRGPYIVDEHTKAQMKKVLTEIQNGTFARQWIAEYKAGNANYKAMKQADLDHPIEATGKKLRAAMAWLSTAPQPSSVNQNGFI